jgi:hypothetical protein
LSAPIVAAKNLSYIACRRSVEIGLHADAELLRAREVVGGEETSRRAVETIAPAPFARVGAAGGVAREEPCARRSSP